MVRSQLIILVQYTLYIRSKIRYNSLAGKLILKRFEHAHKLSEESEKDLNELMQMSPGNVWPQILWFKWCELVQFSVDDVAEWEREERSHLLQDLGGFIKMCKMCFSVDRKS